MVSPKIRSVADFEQLIVQNNLLIGSNVTLQLSLVNGFQPQVGDTFQTLTAGSTTGEFDTFDAPTLTNGAWDFSQLSSELVGVTAVPEAGSFAALAALGMFWFRRRRQIAVSV